MFFGPRSTARKARGTAASIAMNWLMETEGSNAVIKKEKQLTSGETVYIYTISQHALDSHVSHTEQSCNREAAKILEVHACIRCVWRCGRGGVLGAPWWRCHFAAARMHTPVCLFARVSRWRYVHRALVSVLSRRRVNNVFEVV